MAVKENIYDYLKGISKKAGEDIRNNYIGYEKYIVKTVKHFDKDIELVNRKTKKSEKYDLTIVEFQNPDNPTEIRVLYYLNGEEVNYADLLMEYESEEPIREVINASKENKEKPEKKLEEVQDLEQLEAEKKQEENKEKKATKAEKDGEEKKKRKPSYVIETVNPDKAKMDYWQTVKQAFGLPSQVATLAFAYPVSSEDKVDYANITVYMLDKDGNIIDDLDVDNYFEFDSATGNNPYQDKVVRHEEDENKGKAQLDNHNTMIRLKAKNNNDKNSYISLEQQDDLGDYNDINVGRKAVAGTQNVEKQLETDRVRVWDSERELLMRSNAGIFNMNEISDEAEQHKEHGDEGYIGAMNADGKEDTKAVCSKNIYLVYQCLLKLKENEYISENYSDSEIIKRLIDIIDNNPEISPDELINKFEGDIMGDTEGEHGHSNENKEDIANEDVGKFREGPWDSAKH